MTTPASVSLILIPAPAPASPAARAAALAALAEAPGGEVLVLRPAGAAGPSPDGAREVPVDPGAGRGAWLAAGAAAARGEVLVCLHADARPHPGFLAPLLEAVARQGVAVAGSRLVDPDGGNASDGLILTYGRPWPLGVASHGDSTGNAGRRAALPVAAVPDVALAVTAARLAALGGFDPAFTAGGAAVDLCLRAGDAGLRTLVVRRSVVAHDPACPLTRGDEPLLSRRWFGKVPVFDADRLLEAPRRPPRPGRPALSVVVAAAGAGALPRFLAPLIGSLGASDELLVTAGDAGDGTAEFLEVLARDAALPMRCLQADPGAGLPGAARAALAAARHPLTVLLHPAAAPPPELLDEVTRFLEGQDQFPVVAFPVGEAGVVACGRSDLLKAVGAASPEAFFERSPVMLEAAVLAAGGRARVMGGG